jgi:hypothetical protein
VTKARKKELRELSERRGLIDELSAEVDRQRASYSERASAMTTRLSILVAAASLTASMQLNVDVLTGWYVVGVFMAGGAALVGAAGLWPVSGSENGVKDLQDELWNESPDRAAYILMHRKLDILRDDERVLAVRAWLSRVGFALLGLSVIAIAIHLTRIL